MSSNLSFYTYVFCSDGKINNIHTKDNKMKTTIQKMIEEIESDLSYLNHMIDKLYDTSLDAESSAQRTRLERNRDLKVNQLVQLFKAKEESTNEVS